MGLALAFLLLAVAAEAEHAEWGFRGRDASDWDEPEESVRARFRAAGYEDGGERDPWGRGAVRGWRREEHAGS